MSKLKMKTTATLMTILFLASIIAIPVQAKTGVNLVNGDFESPEVTHLDKWDIFDSGTDGLGWMVEWADDYTGAPETAKLELHRAANGWSSYNGEQYAELDTDWDGPDGSLKGEPASVKIYQDLETLPGKLYTLSYAWSPRPNHDDNELKVYWDGNEVGYHSGSGGNNTEWHPDSCYVLATSSLTRLEFVEVGTPSARGMFLDAVSIARVHTAPFNCEISITLIWTDTEFYWHGTITGDIEGTFIITPDPDPSFPGSTEHFLETWVIETDVGDIELSQEGVWNFKTGMWRSNGMVTAATGPWMYFIGANVHVSCVTTLPIQHGMTGTGTLLISGFR